MLYSQKGDHIVNIDSVTSLHPIYKHFGITSPARCALIRPFPTPVARRVVHVGHTGERYKTMKRSRCRFAAKQYTGASGYFGLFRYFNRQHATSHSCLAVTRYWRHIFFSASGTFRPLLVAIWPHRLVVSISSMGFPVMFYSNRSSKRIVFELEAWNRQMDRWFAWCPHFSGGI